MPVSVPRNRYRRPRRLLVVEPPFLPVRTRRWQPGLDGIVADEIFVFRVIAKSHVRCDIPDFGLAALVQFMADRLPKLFVDHAHFTFKERMNRSMI